MKAVKIKTQSDSRVFARMARSYRQVTGEQ